MKLNFETKSYEDKNNYYDKDEDIEYQNLLHIKCKIKHNNEMDEDVEKKYTLNKDQLGKSFSFLVITNSISLIILISTIFFSLGKFFISTLQREFLLIRNNFQMSLVTHFIFWIVLIGKHNQLSFSFIKCNTN